MMESELAATRRKINDEGQIRKLGRGYVWSFSDDGKSYSGTALSMGEASRLLAECTQRVEAGVE